MVHLHYDKIRVKLADKSDYRHNVNEAFDIMY